MEAIYKNKPIYRQAYILSERCKDLGIKLVYNQRNKMVYISLLNAPSMVKVLKKQNRLLYYVLVIFLTLETISNI